MNVDIRRAMKAKNVTLQELSERLNVTRNAVYYYINQADKNSVDNLQKIAKALDCSLLDLFAGRDGAQCGNSEQAGKQIAGFIKCPRCGCVLEFRECEDGKE